MKFPCFTKCVLGERLMDSEYAERLIRQQKMEKLLLDSVYFIILVKKLSEKAIRDGAYGQETYEELIKQSDTCLAEIQEVLGIGEYRKAV
jgi:hypothetical protein